MSKAALESARATIGRLGVEAPQHFAEPTGVAGPEDRGAAVGVEVPAPAAAVGPHRRRQALLEVAVEVGLRPGAHVERRRPGRFRHARLAECVEEERDVEAVEGQAGQRGAAGRTGPRRGHGQRS